MGSEKAFERVGGLRILDRIVSRLAPQVTAAVINANGDPGRFASSGLAVIPDLRSGAGTPLAGLHAAISHAAASGYDAALTVPCDVPFIPRDLVERLCQHGGAAVAASGGQAHYLTGLWPSGCLSEVEAALSENPLPRMQDWVRRRSAIAVAWPTEPFDPFLNVNTPQDLAEANRIAERFSA